MSADNYEEVIRLRYSLGEFQQSAREAAQMHADTMRRFSTATKATMDEVVASTGKHLAEYQNRIIVEMANRAGRAMQKMRQDIKAEFEREIPVNVKIIPRRGDISPQFAGDSTQPVVINRAAQQAALDQRLRLQAIEERAWLASIATRHKAESVANKVIMAERLASVKAHEASELAASHVIHARYKAIATELRITAGAAIMMGNYRMGGGAYAAANVANMMGQNGGVGSVLTPTRMAVGGPVALVAGLALAIKYGAELNKEFRMMSTLMDSTGKSAGDFESRLGTIRAEAYRLSTQFNVAAEDIAKGFKTALSSGIEEADLAKFSEGSITLARALGTSFDHTVDILTSFKDAYGLTISDLSHVNDVLFNSIDKGKFSVEQLLSQIGRVIPVASQAGISIEAMMGALATLTRQGFTTSNAVTSLASFINDIIDPSERAKKTFDELGLKFGVAAFQGRKAGEEIIGMVEDIKAATGNNPDVLSKLLGDERALRGGSALTKTVTLLKDITSATNDVGTASTAAARAQASFVDDLGSLWKGVTNSIKEVGIVLDQTAYKFIHGFGGSGIPDVSYRATNKAFNANADASMGGMDSSRSISITAKELEIQEKLAEAIGKKSDALFKERATKQELVVLDEMRNAKLRLELQYLGQVRAAQSAGMQAGDSADVSMNKEVLAAQKILDSQKESLSTMIKWRDVAQGQRRIDLNAQITDQIKLIQGSVDNVSAAIISARAKIGKGAEQQVREELLVPIAEQMGALDEKIMEFTDRIKKRNVLDDDLKKAEDHVEKMKAKYQADLTNWENIQERKSKVLEREHDKRKALEEKYRNAIDEITKDTRGFDINAESDPNRKRRMASGEMELIKSQLAAAAGTGNLDAVKDLASQLKAMYGVFKDSSQAAGVDERKFRAGEDLSYKAMVADAVVAALNAAQRVAGGDISKETQRDLGRIRNDEALATSKMDQSQKGQSDAITALDDIRKLMEVQSGASAAAQESMVKSASGIEEISAVLHTENNALVEVHAKTQSELLDAIKKMQVDVANVVNVNVAVSNDVANAVQNATKIAAEAAIKSFLQKQRNGHDLTGSEQTSDPKGLEKATGNRK